MDVVWLRKAAMHRPSLSGRGRQAVIRSPSHVDPQAPLWKNPVYTKASHTPVAQVLLVTDFPAAAGLWLHRGAWPGAEGRGSRLSTAAPHARRTPASRDQQGWCGHLTPHPRGRRPPLEKRVHGLGEHSFSSHCTVAAQEP